MKKTILTFIKGYGPIKGRNLLRGVNSFRSEPVSERKMRRCIEALIKDGYSIASSSEGYSFIKNLSQAVTAREYMRKPLAARAERANMILANFNASRQDGPMIEQIRLF